MPNKTRPIQKKWKRVPPMPRFKQVPEILRLMDEKDRIRNIGIIAHIDHGKTTLTDSLLAHAGLLSPNVAGSARALDYLDQEQKRGITIKTANVSLLHHTQGRSYLINLIDTPGHVDFTGKVARALRAIDAAVVVVDAVEGIMAQTETVTRQALEERVKPILFINKIDRLVRELKLDEDAINEKSLQILRDFNNLIEVFGEPAFKDNWKANPENGSVILGSALHKWGFKLSGTETTETNLADVIRAYTKNEQPELSMQSPLHKAILDLCVTNCPSPVEAQRYRIPKIWKGNLDSKIGKAMLDCDENGPTAICITGVNVDSKSSIVATGRVFAGSVKKGDLTYLVGARKEETVRQVSLHMSSFTENAARISSGNIAAISGLESAKAGETVVSATLKADAQPFENRNYVSEAIVALAVEPEDPNELPRMVQALHRLAIEDPNLVISLDAETGENLLSGMGELHLETAVEFLREYAGKIEIKTSKPTTEYRETITMKGSAVTAKSLNRKNKVTIRVEPMLNKSKADYGENRKTWAFDEKGDNKLVCHADCETPQATRNAIIAGFRWACAAGPLCAEPIRNIVASLLDIEAGEASVLLDSQQITKAASRAILGSLLTAQPVILEPLYKIEVSVPTQWMGACVNILARRRGKIQMTEQRNMTVIIRGLIPVAETFGLTADMRSSTSGRAFWQCTFDRWQQMPEKLASEVIREIRARKGLPPDIPNASKFTEQD